MKKLSLILSFLTLSLSITGCNILKNEPEKNAFEDINPLDEYEMRIVKNMKKNPTKDSLPKLVYATDKDAVILNHNGIIIINVPYGKIMHAVDNKKIGLNRLDGDNMTVVESDGDNLLIYNLKDEKKKKAILMDIHSLTIKAKPDLSEKNYKKINLLDDKSVIDKISDNGKNNVQAIQITDNDILAFKVDDKSSVTNWQICIYDKNTLDPVRSFLVFK